MKKEVPKGVFVGIVAVLVIGVGLALTRMNAGSGSPSKPLATDYQGEPGSNRNTAK